MAKTFSYARLENQSIIHSLTLYLDEKEENLLEDSLEDSRSEATQHIRKVLVVHGAEGEDPDAARMQQYC